MKRPALQAVRRDVEREGSVRRRAGPVPGRDAGAQGRSGPEIAGGREEIRGSQGPKVRKRAAEGPRTRSSMPRSRLAEAALKEAEVRAPGPGRVLRILAHPGELERRHVLEMGDVSSMVARAEVYQSRCPANPPGDPAEVDILGNRVPGKVTQIGETVGGNRLTSVDPRALRDLRVVEVTIQLDHSGRGVALCEYGSRGHDPSLGRGAGRRRGPATPPLAGSRQAPDEPSLNRGCPG